MSATIVEDRLKRQRDSLRVLSIQSHVVSGYAGNKCSVFPLQLHGFEVDVINSVQFSNHTGYEKGIRGDRLTSKNLATLYEGLKVNAINKYSHVLSGYCGDPTFLREISSIIRDIRRENGQLLYVCDPVLGDNGKFYVPQELAAIYRDEILPLADIITPNVFELSQLTGMQVSTEKECLAAIRRLHKSVPVVVVTSGISSPTSSTTSYCYASRMSAEYDEIECYRFAIPMIRGHFVGTGDVFTSLLLVWLTETDGDISKAVCNVIASMQLLLKRTSAAAFEGVATTEHFQPNASRIELRLIQSRFDLLVPEGEVEFTRVE